MLLLISVFPPIHQAQLIFDKRVSINFESPQLALTRIPFLCKQPAFYLRKHVRENREPTLFSKLQMDER